MSNAPIALFVFNRPRHTERTIESLKANYGALESDLYIFSDGPRTTSDKCLVSEVRSIINNIDGFNSVTVIEKNENSGLANSIICGVTELCDRHGKVIVLEDDLLTSPHFLEYMNCALDRYDKESRVMHVSGYMFPVEGNESLPDTFFLRMTSSWGWATWKRAWSSFDPSAIDLVRKIDSANLKREFNLMGAYNYHRMLRKQCAGAIDSWAIRWYASVFLKSGLGLFPSRSYVKNIGFDDSGTHCGNVGCYDVDLRKSDKVQFPRDIHLCDEANISLQGFYQKNKESVFRKITRFFRKRF